jgi:hypothetical protein
MATLGGSSFAWNAIEQDYNIIETLECLYELCDEISIAVGGTDGTILKVCEWINSTKGCAKPIHIHIIKEEEWHSQQGREKLSYFSNIAIGMLTTDYNFYLQSDEILHESSFPFIRQAIETGQEAFLVTRHNLWASPYTMLNVPQNRKPVSTEVIRLAKTQYRCVDDAESLGVSSLNTEFVNDIRIYHMGFVRDKNKHLVKIKHMQEKVFLWDVDKRIHDNTDGFDCWLWGFFPEDVVPITEPLPKFIQAWAKEREVDPFKPTTKGIEFAKRFLTHTKQLECISTYGFSPDGWSILDTANSIWWNNFCKYKN